MKLELKHLAPYLPYELKICYRILDLENGNPNTDNPDDRMMDCILKMDGARMDRCLLPETDRWYDKNSLFKPILRPLSDLDKEIPWNFSGVDYGTLIRFSDKGFFRRNVYEPYCFENITNGHFDMAGQLKYFTYLYAHHFDVFGLITAGLAIDINTLKP